jgi:hypothetical protein
MPSSETAPYTRDGWLIQEQLPTEWHILVAAILLNQSRRNEAWDNTLWQLFGEWPTALTLASSDPSLEKLLKPHGFSNMKAKRLRRMSAEYLVWDKKSAKDLYGCGQYAYDSWRVFVKGDRPKPHEINDKALVKFLERYHAGWRIGQPLPALFRISDPPKPRVRVRKSLPVLQDPVLGKTRVYISSSGGAQSAWTSVNNS